MNRVTKRLPSTALVCLAVFATSGCFSLMSYQTADTVPKGGVELGFGWSATSIPDFEITYENGETQKPTEGFDGTIPNLLPDTLLRFGLGDNLDMGLRLFFLGIQGDVKFRVINADVFSLAIAPGVFYSRPFIVFAQYGAVLPILFSLKLGESVKFYGGMKAEISGWGLDLKPQGEEFSQSTNIRTVGVGGHLGLSFGGKRWFIRPEVGYTTQLLGLGETSIKDIRISYTTYGLAFGFDYGVDDEKQDSRIEELEERLRKLESDKTRGPTEGEKPSTDEIRQRSDDATGDPKKEEKKPENP